MILISHPQCIKSSANSNNDLSLWLYKNGSNLVQFATDLGYTGTAINNYFSASFSYLDSPATTSLTTYKIQFSNPANTGSAGFCTSGATSVITLMEIAG